MKPLFIFLTAIILMMITSCEKTTEEIVSDNILFSNLSSPIAAVTVRDWATQNLGVCSVSIPIPSDSSAILFLDMNGDNENDFKISLSHYPFITDQYCGHCSVFHYDIKIQGMNVSDSIAVSVNKSLLPTYFKDSDVITANGYWINDAILIKKNRCTGLSFDVEDEYIGIKHNNQVGWIKLESTPYNGIKIENYAINLTANKDIFAGQTE